MSVAVDLVDEDDQVDGGCLGDIDEVEPDPASPTSRRAQWPDAGLRPEAAAAWRELSVALDAHTRAPLPCQTNADLWFSPDRRARAVAVEGCLTCPVLAACGAFAEANRETLGIWGARSRSQASRTPRRARAA